jgi:hypothetical protein
LPRMDMFHDSGLRPYPWLQSLYIPFERGDSYRVGEAQTKCAAPKVSLPEPSPHARLQLALGRCMASIVSGIPITWWAYPELCVMPA